MKKHFLFGAKLFAALFAATFAAAFVSSLTNSDTAFFAVLFFGGLLAAELSGIFE